MSPTAINTTGIVSSGSMTTLIAGATGYIGQFVAEASLASGVTTYVLCRPGFFTPSKVAAIEALKRQGAIIVEGSVNDKELMENILREFKIDVVIALMGGRNIADQLPLIEAIKAVGTVKRFLPSEFGNDIERASPVEPGLRLYNLKKKIRRTIEDAEINYTYICCNSIAGWPYYDKHHVTEISPPTDQFPIYGDDTFKVYYVAGCDIGKFTIKAAFDARTLNKSVHFRPACNFLRMNELASLWEKKIGRTLPRVIVTGEELLSVAAENRIPESIVASFTYEVYIKGCQTSFSMDELKDVEVSYLYPDIPFKTVDECFNQFVPSILVKQGGEKAPTESMMGRVSVPAI